jgi:hypothetical protein
MHPRLCFGRALHICIFQEHLRCSKSS